MRGFLILFFSIWSIHVSSQCADAGRDTLVCSFNYGLTGAPVGGTWSYYCTDSTKFVEISPLVNNTAFATVPVCGTYSFVYTVSDSLCTDSDTVDVSFEDPGNQRRTLSYDFKVEYGAHGCPEITDDTCGNVRILDGPDAPRPLWTIELFATCMGNYPDPIVTNIDSTTCTAQINHIGVTVDEVDSLTWFSSQNAFVQVDFLQGEIISNQFPRFLNILESNIGSSLDTLCRPIDKCFIDRGMCVDTVFDTIKVPLPVHLGGRWNLVDANGSTPLNDTTLVNTGGKDYFIVIQPGARFFGNGEVTFSLFEESGGQMVDLEQRTSLDFFWVEEWIIDTVDILRPRLINTGECPNCGVTEQVYANIEMPDEQTSFCPTINLIFKPPIKVEIVGESNLCEGGFVILDAGEGWAKHMWSNGVTSRFNFADTGGIYRVVVEDSAGCVVSDEYLLTALSAPDFDIVTDTNNFCIGDCVTLSLRGDSIRTYFWSNGVVDMESKYVMESDTTVTLVVTDSFGCEYRKSIDLQVNLGGRLDAGEDKLISCADPTTFLEPDQQSLDTLNYFIWKGPGINAGNERSRMPSVDQAGVYILFGGQDSIGCLAKDTVIVSSIDSMPMADAGNDMLINCINDSIRLNGSASSQGADINITWTGPGINANNENEIRPKVGQPGDYIITVCFTRSGCCSSDTVGVGFNKNRPTADAGPDKRLTCDTTSVRLGGSGTSQGFDIIYRWTGPGINAGNINDRQPLVNAPGRYSLLVTDTISGCTSLDQVDVDQFGMIPVANAGEDQVINCINSSVVISVNGSSSGNDIIYIWRGPAINDQNRNNTTIQIDVPGEYILLVEDTLGNCTALDTVNVILDVDFPEITAGTDLTIDCNTSDIQLQGAIIGSSANLDINWSGPSIFTGNMKLIQPPVDQGGQYILTVEDTTNHCVSMDTVEVMEDFDPATVEAGPDLQLTCDVSTVTLQGNIINFDPRFGRAWSGPSGFRSSDLNPQVNLAGTYVLEVTAANRNCNSSDSMMVTLDTMAPNVDAGETAFLGCNSDVVTLTGDYDPNSVRSVVWSAINGNIVGNVNTRSILVDQIGLYRIEITGTNGCIGFDTVSVLPWEEFDLDVTDIRATCEGSSDGGARIIIGGGTAPFELSLNGGPFERTLNYTGLPSGTYDLVVRDGNGCIKEISFSIEEIQGIIPPDTTEFSISLCDSDQLIIGHDFGFTDVDFEWSDDPSIPVQRFVSEPGTYILSISNSCDTIEITYVIQNETLPDQEALKELFDIPNAFTPNNDGQNDEFRVSFSDPANEREIERFEMIIFNRWGQEVFKTNSFDEVWRGTSDGEDVPQEIYLVVINIAFMDCEGNALDAPTIAQDLTLIR